MKSQQSDLILVGVGGGGCHIAAATVADFGEGLHAVGFDTDALTARALKGMRCMLLGAARFDGRATGGDVVKGRTAATDDSELLRGALSGFRTAIVVTTLGGGVGGGATPEVLRILRELGAHTLCFAVLPFSFEGAPRRSAAERALPLIEENSDALVTVPLDDLFADLKSHPLAEALPQASATLAMGLSLFWRLIMKPGFIPIGVETIHDMLRQSGGRCRFAVSSGLGAQRGAEACARLARSTLLGRNEAGFAGAQAVMLGVLAGADLCLAELGEISKNIECALPQGCHLRLGTMLDERYAGQIRLVALIFDAWRGAAAVSEKYKDEIPLSEQLIPPASSSRPQRGRSQRSSKLSFGATGKGRFSGVEATLRNGEDLDVPTYLRRGITLDR